MDADMMTRTGRHRSDLITRIGLALAVAGLLLFAGLWMAARRDARGPLVIAEAEARTTAAFARMDADSDGVMTVAERRNAREQMRGMRQERRAERVARRTAARSQTQSPPAPGSE